MKTFRIIVIIFAVALGFSYFITGEVEDDCTKWVQNHGESVVNVERKVFSTGPYWPNKKAVIYRVETDKNNVYWFKSVLWWFSVHKELEDGKYQKLQ